MVKKGHTCTGGAQGQNNCLTFSVPWVALGTTLQLVLKFGHHITVSFKVWAQEGFIGNLGGNASVRGSLGQRLF